MLVRALDSAIADYEDAVLEQSARLVAVDAIVTRNLMDFEKSVVPALDPRELLAAVEAMESVNPALDDE